MFYYMLGSAITAVGGLLFVSKFKLPYFIRWHMLLAKFNYVATKAVIADILQARYNKTELPNLSGRVAIVTGGSRGIGKEIVKKLLKCNLEVIIACRSPPAGDKAIKDIRESGVETGKASVMELDNASLESVRRFVEKFSNNYESLDILINNAGVMFTPYSETKDGYEQQYGVNYLSHFLLTVSLLPLLKKAGTSKHCSRIVNVSSCAHLLGKIHLNDVNLKDDLTSAAYAQSKLAQLLFTKYLARYFEDKNMPIVTNAVHPGIVFTDLFEHTYLESLKLFTKYIFKKSEDGATPIVFAAVSPKMENKSGHYISNCLDSPVNPLAHDELLQDQLFKLSLKQVKLEKITI